MSPSIDHIEDWIGQTVASSDGGRLGKLEDIVFTADGAPVLGAVSTGLFGRRTSLVPIGQATVAPDRITVPYTKSMVKDAPQLDAVSDMTPAVEDQAEIHYGLPER